MGFLPVCRVLVLWSEADCSSGIPCCLVWCRLEIIVERSPSRLEQTHRKRQHNEKQSTNWTLQPETAWEKKEKDEIHSIKMTWAALTTEILHLDIPVQLLKKENNTPSQRLCSYRWLSCLLPLSSEVCNALWQTTASSTFRSHPCSSYALRCTNEHIHNS